MKLIDKINEKMKKGETFFSFEYFPPRTEEVRTTIPHLSVRWSGGHLIATSPITGH